MKGANINLDSPAIQNELSRRVLLAAPPLRHLVKNSEGMTGVGSISSVATCRDDLKGRVALRG